MKHKHSLKRDRKRQVRDHHPACSEHGHAAIPSSSTLHSPLEIWVQMPTVFSSCQVQDSNSKVGYGIQLPWPPLPSAGQYVAILYQVLRTPIIYVLTVLHWRMNYINMDTFKFYMSPLVSRMQWLLKNFRAGNSVFNDSIFNQRKMSARVWRLCFSND